MRDLYNYEDNIEILKGNKHTIICVTDEILTFIENTLHDGAEYHREYNHEATANEIIEMWRTIVKKDDEANAKHQASVQDEQ